MFRYEPHADTSGKASAENNRHLAGMTFSLRTVLIVCALLCVLLAWLTNVVSQVRREQAAVAFLRSKGASVFYVDNWDLRSISAAQRSLFKRILGYGESRPINTININLLDPDDAASVMAHVRHLRDLRNLRLVFPQTIAAVKARNEAFQPLETLSRLKVLDLVNAPVDDGVLRYLRSLKEMRDVGMIGSDITDLVELRNLHDLHYLHLESTNVSDAGLEQLSNLRQLKHLGLNNSKVTPEGVQAIQRQLPNCKVTH